MNTESTLDGKTMNSLAMTHAKTALIISTRTITRKITAEDAGG